MNKKIIAGAALLSLSTLSLSAQEADAGKNKLSNTFKERKSELGLLAQIFNGSARYSAQGLLGVQFKRWVKPNVAFRILAAYNPYSYSQKPYVIAPYTTDSFRVQYNSSNVDMIALGFGVEAQRQFYKRVFFFAGMELLAGYGAGKTFSYSRIVPIENIYYNRPGNVNLNYEEASYRKSYIRLIPGVGAKIVFKKINFGLEVQFASLGIESERTDRKKYTIPDIDVFNNIAYRLHINYRF